jgi:hypothetical protein
MSKAAGSILGDVYDAWRAQDLDWLASYLPDDFCHVMHVPAELYAMGGPCQGKQRVLDRWRIVVPQYEFLRFDTSTLMIDKDRGAVEISLQYRHRQTGALLDGTKANFWMFEAGWPVKLTEYYDVAALGTLKAQLTAHAGA